jgi:uncharacterized membrane protein YeaQ/YmgE (transglycosylase-associated protein family)
MESLLPIIVQAIAGLVGGNIAGLLNKARSLGPLLNSILGAVGGVAGAQGAQAAGIFEMLGMAGTGTEPSALAAQGGIGAIVGLLLPLIASLFKSK